jgi:hypothetical protein
VVPASGSTSVEIQRAARLVEEGSVLGDRGDWNGALEKFRKAAELAEAPALRFNIALSEERLGRLVAALTDFRLAQREAARGDAPQVSAGVGAHITALEPRIASFAFQRPADAERAVIFVDGNGLADPASSRTEVDPGPHRITALVDGVTRFQRVVSIGEGASATITLVLTPLPPPPPPPPPVAGYVLGATGLVSLGVMGVFIGLRQSAIADLNGECPQPPQCFKSAGPDITRGRVDTGVAEGAAVVGVLSIAAATYFLLRTAPRKQTSTAFVAAASAGRQLGALF